jgi:transposase
VGFWKNTPIAKLIKGSRVIHYWIETGQLDRDLDRAPPRTMRPRPTKLDAYHAIIRERLATYPELSATRLFEEVRAAGYAGGVTQVREFVGRVRPAPEPEPVVRFETPPAHQAQVDFAEFRFPWGKRYALLVVLSYSRLLWVQFYARQTLATIITGLEAAFAYFGGVPHELLFDQLKAAIVEDERADGGKLLENPEFLRFARHWSFRIRAYRPYRAKTKGKVERPVRYVRGNFAYGRDFVGDADLNAEALRWLDTTANQRVHRTINAVPRERFEADERALLQPLALRGYRPLVLPAARNARRTTLHVLAPAAGIVVEQRALRHYQALVDADVDAGADAGAHAGAERVEDLVEEVV